MQYKDYPDNAMPNIPMAMMPASNTSMPMYPTPPCMMQNQYYMPQAMPNMVAQDPYSYPQNLPEALLLIQGAVSGEREDELFYEYLISVAPTEEDKDIIRSIRDDERKHFKMFRQIYYELTGQTIQPNQNIEFEKPKSYCAGLQKALFGELGAVERYRRILFALQDRRHINMLTEIITDELKHANKYNFLYSKNSCQNK
jgi:rubrerythrin